MPDTSCTMRGRFTSVSDHPYYIRKKSTLVVWVCSEKRVNRTGLEDENLILSQIDSLDALRCIHVFVTDMTL
jgi:hypothetical protein